MKSWTDIRKAATAFSKRWKNAYDEKSQAQSFLKEFFAVFGVDAVTVATFEHRVKFADGSQGYADCLWPGTLLIEMKSRGKDLDAAYQQAMDYVRSLAAKDPEDAKKGKETLRSLRSMRQKTHGGESIPRAIVVSDFARVRFYDLAHDCALTEFALKDLRKYVTLFGYMIGDDGGEIREQDPVNRRAAEKMARLHDAMKAVGYAGHPLEIYLVRLLFCLFAEDTGIFKPDQFSRFVAQRTAGHGGDLAQQLAALFETLNTPPERRLSILDETLAAFPYVNGGLFAETLPMAAFSAEMRRALLDCGALDWSKISPAIFGAMFQGVMDEKARHDLGAHYTDEANILKLIRPLFLDALRAEFDAIAGKSHAEAQSGRERGDAVSGDVSQNNPKKLCGLRLSATLREKKEKLQKFHAKIASLTFLDPACGCGNFLLVAYRELRRLEMDVLEELYRDDPGQFLDISDLCKVGVSQFYGIEIEPFPAEIAKVALWLMDHLCNMEVADRFGQYFARIPIKDSPHIVCANALTIDWARTDYIFGNPPFLGRTQKGPERQAEIARFFDYKDIDYVACWYAKANDYMNGALGERALPGDGRAGAPRTPLPTRCAFVSTNSITQGEQVAPLWRRMNAEIDFAYQTFKWHNEVKGVAAVHCVIIGFHRKGGMTGGTGETGGTGGEGTCEAPNVPTPVPPAPPVPPVPKTLYSPDGTPHYAAHINGYLQDAPDVYFSGRPKPLWECAPLLTMGNMPLDGGNLIIEAGDLPKFVGNSARSASAPYHDDAGRACAPRTPHHDDAGRACAPRTPHHDDAGRACAPRTPHHDDAGRACAPRTPPYIKRLTGSKEYIQGLPRYCLWLKDAEPSLIRSMPLVMERVAKCREWRLASKSADTRKHAATPTLFREQNNPRTAIIIPKTSSEKRDYIPIGFIDDSVIVTDAAFLIPGATLYHFGILTSRMHMAWMRAVAGRLEMSYRYSKDIVYNNFPWPEGCAALTGTTETTGTDATATTATGGASPMSQLSQLSHLSQPSHCAAIAAAAQAVLDARAAHPNATLADLYDPLTMPPDLVKAHAHLDALVDKAYGLGAMGSSRPTVADADRVAHLFKLYAEKAGKPS